MPGSLLESVVLITSKDADIRTFGTGFIIHHSDQGTYLLTCAHVVNDMGGSERVLAAGRPAQVVACGDANVKDLAVLYTEEIVNRPPLKLQSAAKGGDKFVTAGFQALASEYLIRATQGILAAPIELATRGTADRVPGWDLTIDDLNLLPGNSGSPVFVERSEAVAAVITHRQGDGKKGFAVSVELLLDIWPGMPSNIRISLTGSISERKQSVATPSGRALKVFLCHGSQDKPTVRALYQRLQNDGIQPWLDEEDLLPGQDWKREITRAVKGSDIVLVCLSQITASKSGFVQREIKLALDVADEKPEGTIFIIPLRLEECEVPDRLSGWQWVNYYEAQGYEKLKRALQAQSQQLTIEAPSQIEGNQSDKAFKNSSSGDEHPAGETERSANPPQSRRSLDLTRLLNRVASIEGNNWLLDEQRQAKMRQASELLGQFRDELTEVSSAIETLTRNETSVGRDTELLNIFKQPSPRTGPDPIYKGDIATSGHLSGVHIYAGVELLLWEDSRVRLWGLYGIGGQTFPVPVLFDRPWEQTEETTLDSADLSEAVRRIKAGLSDNLEAALERFISEREQLRNRGIKTFRFINPTNGLLVARIQADSEALASDLFRVCVQQRKAVQHPGFLSGEPAPTVIEFNLAAIPTENSITIEEEQ